MPLRCGLVPGLLLWLATATANAEVSELKITKQPGLLFAPMLLMEHGKLIEKHAAQAGVPGLKASWLTIMSGGANNDALLSGSVHITTSGVTNMLLLWSKTNGDVKAIIGVSGLPFKLVTRNPNIKTIKDYGPNDRIAVPTVRQSIQAITLGIALQKAYGDDKANERLVPNQVQMGHPDALTALLNPQHEVTSHFASSPFQEIELKNPGVHVVLESRGTGRRRTCCARLQHHKVLRGESEDSAGVLSRLPGGGRHDQKGPEGCCRQLSFDGEGARQCGGDRAASHAKGCHLPG
jgi:NitT/TauT family transport system substrate-binding protein